MDDIINIGNINFKYNKNEESYSAFVETNYKKILIKNYDLENIKNSLIMTSKLIKNLDENFLKEVITKNLYDKKSEDIGLSREEYMDAIDLDIISIDDEYIEYWFDDSEIYGGHNIILKNKIGTEKIIIDFA